MSHPAGSSAEPVIRVENLRKHYGETAAVDGVSFEVLPGTIFGLLGPNGAGKTTTVEVLEGLREPDAGEVRVLGIDAVHHSDDLRARIGVSLQTAALYPKLTVTEVLTLFRGFYPSGRTPEELIALMDLGEKRSTRTQNLSGGQRQRLGRPRPGQRPGARLPRRADDRDGPGGAACPVGRRPRARLRLCTSGGGSPLRCPP